MFQMIRCLIYVFLDKLLFSSFFVAKLLLRWPKSFPASVNFWFELFTCCFFRKICIVSCPSTQSHTMLSNIIILAAFLHIHRGLGGLGSSSWKIKICEWEIIHGSRRKTKFKFTYQFLCCKNLQLPSQISHASPAQWGGQLQVTVPGPWGLQVPPFWHGFGLQGSGLYKNRKKWM